MRIFIVGSCVSRDAFNLTTRVSLAGYVARTSLASAFGSPLPWLTKERIENALESPFQRRLVDTDASKRLRRLLEAASYDLLLLDFIDERFSLVQIGSACCTYSSEARKTNVLKAPGAKLVRPTDPLRHQAWKEGLRQLLEVAADKKVRVALNEVWWAEHDEAGERFDPAAVSEGNAHLSRLYEDVPTSVTRIRYPAEIFVGSTTHRWGRSPFHYIDDVSRWLLKSLEISLD